MGWFDKRLPLLLIFFALLGAGVVLAYGNGDWVTLDLETHDTRAPADKYVGTWVSACFHNPEGSGQAVVTISKRTATTLGMVRRIDLYATPDCAGRRTEEEVVETVRLTWTGIKVMAGKPVDKLHSDSSPGGEDDLAFIDNNRLYTGNPDAPRDALGYPEALDDGAYLIRL